MITFKASDFPNMSTHCDQADCGFSLYRGVLVQWDEDHDERVLRFLDEMKPKDLDKLLVVQEHEGCIAFLWKGAVPAYYREGFGFEEPTGDWWTVSSSKAVPNKEMNQ